MPRGRGAGTARGGRHYGRRRRDSGSESDTDYVPASMRAEVKRLRKAANLQSAHAQIVGEDRIKEALEARRVANIDMHMETEENSHDEDFDSEAEGIVHEEDELEDGEILDDDDERNVTNREQVIAFVHDIPLQPAPFPDFTKLPLTEEFQQTETRAQCTDDYTVISMDLDSSQLSEQIVSEKTLPTVAEIPEESKKADTATPKTVLETPPSPPRYIQRVRWIREFL